MSLVESDRRCRRARNPILVLKLDLAGETVAFPARHSDLPLESGHSIEAFAVATIIARRYGNHRWVPYAAYGLASVVGFSRLTLNVHFLSDVFMGGALGYSISRFTVLRQ